MDDVAALLSSITCGRCKSHLLNSYQEYGITQYRCKCSLKVRIVLNCHYCKRLFLSLPYLLRKNNYCTLNCYWSETNRKVSKFCKVCGKRFKIKKYLVEQGFGFYCSKECWFALFKKWKKILKCRQCHQEFSVHRSLYKKHPKFCSKKCADDFKRDYVEKVCRGCRQRFELPRFEVNRGRGSFCTWECYKSYDGETSIERIIRLQLKKLKEPFKQEMRFGKYRADFYLPNKNLIIECDGEYWHRNQLIRQRDYRKDVYLNALGYKILRLKEAEIKKLDAENLGIYLSKVV